MQLPFMLVVFCITEAISISRLRDHAVDCCMLLWIPYECLTSPTNNTHNTHATPHFICTQNNCADFSMYAPSTNGHFFEIRPTSTTQASSPPALLSLQKKQQVKLRYKLKYNNYCPIINKLNRFIKFNWLHYFRNLHCY